MIYRCAVRFDFVYIKLRLLGWIGLDYIGGRIRASEARLDLVYIRIG